jgi:uncharacterized protein
MLGAMAKRRRAARLPLLVSFLVAAACGGAPPQRQAAPPAPATGKAFAPLSIKADAKAPNQALILGTDERNGSTIVPLVGAPARGVVDALFVRRAGEGPPTGGTTPVKLSTAPNTDGSVQVGVLEELSGGTGPSSRAGVWMAAAVAASALGKDLTDVTFRAASGGYLDGASASGLLAAGFLATLTGARIDAAATMTGTINPDGTIGPVAGLPERFKAALDRGKQRIGYPLGLRMARSAATGELVDLVQLAKARGAQAVELASVQDAYQLLTGKRLPEPVPVAAAEMALDDATGKALEARYREWQQRLAQEWAALLQLQQGGGRLPQMLIAMARHAQARGEEAERLAKQGAIAAAYGKVLEAWVFAAAATQTFDVLQQVQQGDVPAAVAALDKLDQLDRAPRELLERVGAMRPATIGDHMLMIGAFQSALRGWGFQAFAADEVRGARRYLERLAGKRKEELATPATADALVAAVAPAIVLIGWTHAETLHGQERLEDERASSLGSLGYTPQLLGVRRLATSFQAAAAAGVTYFDTLLVEPEARRLGIALDAARARVAMHEPDYLVAFMLSRLASRDGMPQELKQQWGEASASWSLLSLAASQLAYLGSAQLIAKHYALQIHTDHLSGQGATALHEQAFASMLETAERAARASARAARIATGAIPVQARLAYQMAGVRRDGDAAARIEALVAYRMSSACSQTSVMLARN